MRRIVSGSLLAALTSLTALTTSFDSQACGGCFIPPVQGNDGGTIVTSHRMALSVSGDQTILWDQIQYTGNPAEFAWVLPVKPGARIDVASQAWFDVLDAATGTSVTPPLLACEVPGFFCSTSSMGPGIGPAATFGCGSSEVSGPDVGTPPDPVQVVSHGATGPYESVVIHSDVPGALSAWLDDHGFVIPDDIVPVIEAYQSEGFDFAALRLLPSAGIQQMRPVRVVQKGAAPVLPLRMVAAGTGPRTAITLFVIGEGRYTTKNIPEVQLPRDRVIWDFATESSTYAQVRDAAYGAGEVFFSPYSEPGALFDEVENPVTRYPSRYQVASGQELATIAEAFVEQAFLNGETASTECAAGLDAYADDGRRVVMPPCDDDFDPECFVDAQAEIDARSLECDPPLGSDIPLDDLAQALIGMHPRDVWVTRLEANLVRKALGQDLVIEAAGEQVSQPGPIQATTGTNIPVTCQLADAVAPFTEGGPGDRRPPGRLAPVFVLAALGALLALRRAAVQKRARPVAPSTARELGVAR